MVDAGDVWDRALSVQRKAVRGFAPLVADGLMGFDEALAALQAAAARAAPQMDRFGREARIGWWLDDAVAEADRAANERWLRLRGAAWEAGAAGLDGGALRSAIADAAGALEPLPPVWWLDEALLVARSARAGRRGRR